MTSSTIKTANAKGVMCFWAAALCITYAMVLLQIYHLAGGVLHDARSASIAARPGMFSVVEKLSGLKFSQLKFVPSNQPLSPEQRNVTLASIIAAFFLIGYLHLKLSVSVGDRNRLAALKARPESEEDKQNFDACQQEQVHLGKLLVAVGALSEEEFAQALDLSNATHRLLGECCISFNWLSASGLTEGLEIARAWPPADNIEAAQEQLQKLRLTEEQVAAKIAQQQEAPTAVSLARSDYKVLLARSVEKKAAKARAALEQSLSESTQEPQSEQTDAAASEHVGDDQPVQSYDSSMPQNPLFSCGSSAAQNLFPSAAQNRPSSFAPAQMSSSAEQALFSLPAQMSSNSSSKPNLSASTQRKATAPMELEQRNYTKFSPKASTAVARSIDAHMQNEEMRALLQRMNESYEMLALFKSDPVAAPSAAVSPIEFAAVPTDPAELIEVAAVPAAAPTPSGPNAAPIARRIRPKQAKPGAQNASQKSSAKVKKSRAKAD